MKITATELNKRPGTYLDRAGKEPVVIEKTGRPTVVMISYERYLELENVYWGEQAIQSDKDNVLSTEESMQFLSSNK